jgi:RimJ/RimL family protein N-acetyltransferase
MIDPQPVTLTGTVVRLEPLELRHAADLLAAAREPAIWRYLPVAMPESVETVERLIELAGEGLEAEAEIPFAVIHLESGKAVGSTRYLDIDRYHDSLEIGWTWYGRAHQRSAVNTECKWLLLRHAFDALGCVRVALKTDARNEASQRAIERIGAVREGVFRKHYRLRDGGRRDSVYYSITDDDWPAIQQRLQALLDRRSPD